MIGLYRFNIKTLAIVFIASVFAHHVAAQVARDIAGKETNLLGSVENSDELLKIYHQSQQNAALVQRGMPHYYEKAYLQAIKFPVGGIGSGCIQFDGKAVPRFWQIFNNMTHDFVPNSFLAIRTKRAEQIEVRALQTDTIAGIQPMHALRCKNEFPFLVYEFQDELPVNVSMKVYNPFIPLNTKESSIPAVFYQIRIENPTNDIVECSLLASQQNAVGFSRVKKVLEGNSFAAQYKNSINRLLVDDTESELYGGNYNTSVNTKGAKTLLMESTIPQGDEHFGQMALMLLDEPTQLNKTQVSAKWTNKTNLLKTFRKTGMVKSVSNTKPSKSGNTWNGALNSTVVLQPGESKIFNLALAWYFPNGKNGGYNEKWDAWGKGKWEGVGNYYANEWKDIHELTEYITTNHKRLASISESFQQTFFQTNFPYWLVERLSSQLAILKSRTIFHDKRGYVGLWEGCGSGDGSCAGNCNHVWHYAQAHARLFPELGRKIREQAYQHIKENGQIPYRQPAGSHAFDGQCGDILATYREHLLSKDDIWLKKQYPQVKKAIDYLTNTWDKDADGWLSGAMHTTYDCSMSGNASFLTSLYVATLKAGSQMAVVCGDKAQADCWADLFQKASKVQNERLWNGSHYVQVPDSLHSANDYKNGCHSDQLLGQWWADQLGLGNMFPAYRMHTAFNAIVKHNFKSVIKYHKQAPREFAKPNEPAFIVTTWPAADRPKNAPVYSDEIWSTYEYTIGASMFKQHQPLDALTLLSAGSQRYDGRLRTDYVGDWGTFGFSGNPFGDDECGQFYSRALSNWSVLLAAQGFKYDGPRGFISFNPTWRPMSHTSFFSAAAGWGLFKQQVNDGIQCCSIELRYGTLPLQTLQLPNLLGDTNKEVSILLNGKTVVLKPLILKNQLVFEFKNVIIRAGDILEVKLK